MTLEEALWYGRIKIGPDPSIHLLSFATGLNLTEIHLNRQRILSSEENTMLNKAIARYESGEPLQYILGHWSFFGFEFNVDPRVLIPRPETEILVETALSFIRPGMRVLDLCTGSGCIGVALALMAEEVTVTAVDIDSSALALAQENCVKNQVPPGRMEFIVSDLFSQLNNRTFDVIISNPPYILTDDITGLDANVRDFEPRLALDGGADGLDLYRRIIPESKKHLNSGGGLFLEIGPPEVSALMHGENYHNVNVVKDYVGRDRVVWGLV